MVLAIAGVMAGFLIQAKLFSDSTECYVTTKAQLNTIRESLERFARKNDRLPLPAARNVGVEDVTYGRESSGANIDAAGGVSWGAVPFQALGLPVSFAGDCWGSKLTYVVTTALTTDSSNGGFKDRDVLGNITQKTTPTVTFSTTSAYAIISHGQDKLGAVKLNYRAANAGGTPDTAHGWCSGADFKQLNCLATGVTIAGGVFNDGKDTAADYFDDVVVASGKPQTLPDELYAFCWGHLPYGGGGNYFMSWTTPAKVYNSGPTGSYNFSKLSMGGSVSSVCGITTAGAAYCWGRGSSGQLGNGGLAASSSPAPVSGGLLFSEIYSGYGNYNCGITSAGAAYCWGDNSNGQLGVGDTSQRLVPTLVSGGLTFSKLTMSTSLNSACGLTTAGKAYCWGANSNGQLGVGDTSQRLVPTEVSPTSPTFVDLRLSSTGTCGRTAAGDIYCWGGGTVSPTMVAGGPYDSFQMFGSSVCALDTGGNAYCWGTGTSGQIGNGSNSNQTTPQPVSGGITFSRFAESPNYIGGSATGFHVCGLTAGGKAYCWGANNNGQLGDNSTTSRNTPVPVLNNISFSKLYVADTRTCGLSTSGIPYCWGLNNAYQLGVSPIISSSPSNILTPTALIGGITFSDMLMGSSSGGCGLVSDGTAYCWGSSGTSLIGDNWGPYISDPSSVSIGALFTTITNMNSATCALNSVGQTYCWGYSQAASSPLGTVDTSTYVLNPSLVSGAPTFRSLSGGSYHICGLTAAGAAYCWGHNNLGQLGTGSNVPSAIASPTLIGGITFSKIDAGGDSTIGGGLTCGIADTGITYCWGGNSMGQLGTGSTSPSYIPTPTAVTGGLTFTKISVGGRHVCGLTSAGAAYCWGANDRGQLGTGSTAAVTIATPTAVTGGHVFSRIIAGPQNTCGITIAGDTYCWGYNAHGQIGDGVSPNPQPTPSLVAGGYQFTDIEMGQNGLGSASGSACGITTDGKMYCWGYNTYGYNGNGTLTHNTTPTQVTGSGSGGRYFEAVQNGSPYSGHCALARPSSGKCTWPWGGGYVPDSGSIIAYQSAAPVGGPCISEHRVCISGTLSGSYAFGSCTPGCPAQVMNWDAVSPGCSGTTTAMAGGGSSVVTNVTGGLTGSATATCSTTGVVTLSGATCAP